MILITITFYSHFKLIGPLVAALESACKLCVSLAAFTNL